MGDEAGDKKRPNQVKKLTKSFVDKAEFDPEGSSNQVWWDTELTGFGVRLNPGGSKTFIFQYRNEAGKLKRVSLGKFGKQLTVEQARKLARMKTGDVAYGGDPLAEQQAKRNAPDELTFAELARWYIDDYAQERRRSVATDEGRLFPKKTTAPMYAFHRMRPGEHSREDVEDALDLLHTRLRATPVEANRVVQLVGTVMNYAVKKRKIRGEFKNIVDRIDMNKEQSRDDWIRPAELPGLVKATKILAAPKSRFADSWAPAVWFTLLTGARMKSETLQLQWKDVHFDVGEFTFVEPKNDQNHTLPMTPTLRAILEKMPRGKSTDYVFGAKDPSNALTDPRKAFAKLRKSHKFVDHITPHALRHTASTYIQSHLHLPEGLNRAVLNQSDYGITATYAHVSLDVLRDALQKLDDFVRAASKSPEWPPL